MLRTHNRKMSESKQTTPEQAALAIMKFTVGGSLSDEAKAAFTKFRETAAAEQKAIFDEAKASAGGVTWAVVDAITARRAAKDQKAQDFACPQSR